MYQLLKTLDMSELFHVVTGAPLTTCEEIARYAESTADVQVEDVVSLPGMTDKRAEKIVASLEIGKRLNNARKGRALFNTPQRIADYFMAKLRYETQEYFFVAYLNCKCKVLRIQKIGIGDTAKAPVDIKESMKWAVRLNASAMVLVHNHPSGEPEPSEADIELTKKFVKAGKVLDVQVVDHIVIGDGVFVSLHERGAC